MSFLNSIRVAIKLPFIMVTLSLMALIFTTVLSYMHARDALAEEAKLRVYSVAQAHARAVATLVQTVQRDLDTQSRNPLVHDAFGEFINGFEAMPHDPTAHLVDWYRTRNPHGPDAYADLDAAADASGYSRAHAKYHPYFRAFVDQSAVSDLFMLDPDGRVVYSVLKGPNFAQNVDTVGTARGLSEAFSLARQEARNGRSSFVDFESTGVDGGSVSGLLAKEIRGPRGRPLGTLVMQLRRDALDGVLQSEADYGSDTRSADIYLINEDRDLRSSFAAEPSGQASLTPDGPSLPDAAEFGVAGVRDAVSLAGEPIISANAPVAVFGENWVVLAERNKSLQLASAHRLLAKIVPNIVILLAVICTIGIVVARSVSVPVVAVGAAMRKIAARDLESGVPCLRRGDEIGDIAKSLKVLRDELQGAAALEAENHFKSAAFHGSSAASMIVDSEHVIRYVNPAAHRLLTDNAEAFRKNLRKFDPDNVVGQSMDVFHGPHSKAATRLVDLDDFPLSVDIKVDDARFALMVNLVCDTDGSRIGYVVEWQDVTVERMQKAVINAIYRHQCTAEFSVDGVLEGHNECLTNAVGTGGLIKGHHRLADLIEECADTKRTGHEIWTLLEKGEQIYGCFKLKSADGHDRWLEGSISPVLDRQNVALKFLMMAADVTSSHTTLHSAEQERRAFEAEQAQVVEALSVGLKQLSTGNLAARLDEPFSERYDSLRCDYNIAAARLNETLCGVIENATAIRSEAREISNAADDLSQRTEKQAGTLEETAAALDELTASVRSAADGAARANAVVGDARENAVRSGAVVSEAVSAMGLIETSSEKISKIINVIDDIAFQTNLLALNAGVEAARAGDAGRGFAVVASEVRALAQRSSEAAKEISELISTSSNHVSRGVDLVAQAGHALEEIVAAVGGIADHVAEISGSAQQQSAGLAEINASVNQLDQVTQQNAAMFEETTAASHSLTREAQNLTDMIAKFKTERRVNSRPTLEALSGAETNIAAPTHVMASKSLAQPGRGPSKQDLYDENSWDEF